MYTKSFPAPPPVPPRNYSGTMYRTEPQVSTPPPEPDKQEHKAPSTVLSESYKPELSDSFLPDKNPECDSCRQAPQEPEKKPGLLSGLFGDTGINIGTEELLLIGLILLLYANDADNDVIIMVAIVLLAGFF